ncbi:RNA pyrophosphohydrolase [Actinoplanes sp. SE50]|uniref:NUDIX hydrolase n=1 Tax=unclassified Actinoplanes TaxID=2626549 RepID=UPI00023ECCBF|nr:MULTISPECIES: NUDIX domain-containing protein [unclassified Actinoplanes]AEV84823.1 RNA pyrophosphohydrolase [Actinoplanes sp. SE50/110]ATO83215.1 RNA pyrophosphohydrolase [Actinoplanes sp. SE50]SLM00622.1 RNA pyrophosphohydrolase [Actinoplanes sp. SE50/110]
MSDPLRRSARVLLLSSTDRVLLLQFRFDPADAAKGHGWATPGGGVQDGEPLAQAATRELHEEVGLKVSPEVLGDPVAYTSGFADLGWASGIFRDEFFAHRVDDHEVDTSGMEDHERGYHAGHRWWTVDELATTTETVYPFGLADLVERLLTEGTPAQPVQLPWHH